MRTRSAIPNGSGRQTLVTIPFQLGCCCVGFCGSNKRTSPGRNDETLRPMKARHIPLGGLKTSKHYDPDSGRAGTGLDGRVATNHSTARGNHSFRVPRVRHRGTRERDPSTRAPPWSRARGGGRRQNLGMRSSEPVAFLVLAEQHEPSGAHLLHRWPWPRFPT